MAQLQRNQRLPYTPRNLTQRTPEQSYGRKSNASSVRNNESMSKIRNQQQVNQVRPQVNANRNQQRRPSPRSNNDPLPSQPTPPFHQNTHEKAVLNDKTHAHFTEQHPQQQKKFDQQRNTKEMEQFHHNYNPNALFPPQSGILYRENDMRYDPLTGQLINREYNGNNDIVDNHGNTKQRQQQTINMNTKTNPQQQNEQRVLVVKSQNVTKHDENVSFCTNPGPLNRQNPLIFHRICTGNQRKPDLQIHGVGNQPESRIAVVGIRSPGSAGSGRKTSTYKDESVVMRFGDDELPLGSTVNNRLPVFARFPFEVSFLPQSMETNVEDHIHKLRLRLIDSVTIIETYRLSYNDEFMANNLSIEEELEIRRIHKAIDKQQRSQMNIHNFIRNNPNLKEVLKSRIDFYNRFHSDSNTIYDDGTYPQLSYSKLPPIASNQHDPESMTKHTTTKTIPSSNLLEKSEHTIRLPSDIYLTSRSLGEKEQNKQNPKENREKLNLSNTGSYTSVDLGADGSESETQMPGERYSFPTPVNTNHPTPVNTNHPTPVNTNHQPSNQSFHSQLTHRNPPRETNSALILKIRLQEIIVALHRVYLEPDGPIYVALLKSIHSPLYEALTISSPKYDEAINNIAEALKNVITKIIDFM
ncbi:unnamed protein product, partial [Didymodactylos carnosus]